MRAMVVAPMLHAIQTSKALPACQNDGGYPQKDADMSMSITDYSGAAAAALAGLNNVTSQMTDVQNQLNTGKAVNGYADNPSVFYAATLMNRQVDALKSSATDLNANLTNINSALTTATSVANTLGSIRDNVSKMTAVGTTAAQAASYATTINTLINSINASVADAITAAASTGKRSLLDNANNDMNITVGNGTMTVNAADMAVAAGDNPDGTRPKGLAIGFTAQDVQNLLTIIKAGAKAGAPTTTTASVTLSASATAPASSTTKDLLSNCYSLLLSTTKLGRIFIQMIGKVKIVGNPLDSIIDFRRFDSRVLCSSKF